MKKKAKNKKKENTKQIYVVAGLENTFFLVIQLYFGSRFITEKIILYKLFDPLSGGSLNSQILTLTFGPLPN
jgi:hypothetical protein